MIKLNEGNAIVSRAIVFPEFNTYIPITVSIGDNCCDSHAQGAAESVIRMYADSLRESEGCIVNIEAYESTEG